MDEKIGAEALSAAIAGFLACQVLTLRFLIQEGIVEKDRLLTYFENAMQEMRPGIEDQRSLFVLDQVINALRSQSPGLQ